MHRMEKSMTEITMRDNLSVQTEKNCNESKTRQCIATVCRCDNLPADIRVQCVLIHLYFSVLI